MRGEKEVFDVEDLQNSNAVWAFILLALVFGKMNIEELQEASGKE